MIHRLTQILAAPYDIDISPLPHVATGDDKVTAILTIVFTIIGALSLLMVTIGGLRYIASQGDPQAVAKAKGTSSTRSSACWCQSAPSLS